MKSNFEKKLLEFFLSASVYEDYNSHRFYATKVFKFNEELFKELQLLYMKQ